MRNYFEFANPAKINCGEDAAHTLGYELTCYGAKRPFVICSIDVVRSGITTRALSSLDGGKKGAAVCFDGVPNKLDLDIVREMKAKFEKEGCDAIVAIGNASVMECAKVLRTFLSQKCEDLLPMAGTDKTLASAIPMVFLPTEIVRGTELNGMISDGEVFVSSPDMIPNVLIIDREVSDKKPLRSLAEGAIYAFGNAIEAYLGAEEDDPAEIYAEKAIRLLLKHAIVASDRAGNKEAATGVALASALAGVAYGNVPFGAAHALSEAIRDVAGVSDEEAMALALFACVKNASESVKEKAEALLAPLRLVKSEANSLEPAEEEGNDSEKAGKSAIDKIEEWLSCLCANAGVVCKISETNIQRESFGDIAEAAQNKRASVTAKGSISKEEFLAILNDAY